MPSPRRVRLLFYVVLAGLVTLLIFTSNARQSKDADTRTIQDFYHKTMNAMDRGGGGKGKDKSYTGGGSARQKVTDALDDDDVVAKAMAERLRLAEQKAKDSANAKAPNKPDAPEDVIGVGSSAGGQTKKEKEDSMQQRVKETKQDHEVETELNGILKKSPIIIFSKTYCPHSKRAKGILLDKYRIDPTPYVVELDTHPLGRKIQDKLAERTGRSTVPNIMIFGVSIGGADDIAALDKEEKLADKIKEIGGRRIVVTERFVDASKAG